MDWLQQARLHDMHRPLKLPERYKDATIQALPAGGLIYDTTVRYAQNFWAEAAKGLAPLYLGKARQYKTYAACALARLANKFISAEFASYPVAFPVLESQRYRSETLDFLAWLRAVPFLVLDDIAPTGGTTSTWQREQLQALFFARFDACKPTVITANLALEVGHEWDTIANAFGPAFARRLQDASDGYRVLIL